MKITSVLLLSLFLLSCGGGGSGADTGNTTTQGGQCLDFMTLTNGATTQSATTYWDCLWSNSSGSTFAFFRDGTGVSSAIGVFTWEESGCNSVTVDSASGVQEISDVNGSLSSGLFTLTSATNASATLDGSCVLQAL